MRHHLASLGLILIVGALVAACGGREATPRPTVPPALPGTEWTLGVQGGTVPASQARQTLAFGADGTVSGFGGCSNYSGTYTTSGSLMTIAGLESQPTVSPCAPETLDVERRYLDALAGTTGWAVADMGDAAPSGAVVLSPIKLTLTGSVELIFSLD